MIEVPLVGGAANSHQTFFAQLGGNFLEFRLNYITHTQDWAMDILREGELLVASAMLKPNCNITITYNAGIGNFIFVGDEPTLDNLGQSNQLVWVADDE